MQILTLLFLLFDALYFVHAAMDPHYVDLIPRDEGAPVEGNASTLFPPPSGDDLVVYPTSYKIGDPIPTGGLTVVFSLDVSNDLIAEFWKHCIPDSKDYDGVTTCSQGLNKIISSQPFIPWNYGPPEPAGIVLPFIALLFIGVSTYLSSVGAVTSPSAAPSLTTPITVLIPPGALANPMVPSVQITNHAEVNCWSETDCTGHVVWSKNITDLTSEFCWDTKNCQCIAYDSTNVAILTWNGNDCTGIYNFAYAPLVCGVHANTMVETAGTNALNLIPVC